MLHVEVSLLLGICQLSQPSLSACAYNVPHSARASYEKHSTPSTIEDIDWASLSRTGFLEVVCNDVFGAKK